MDHMPSYAPIAIPPSCRICFADSAALTASPCACKGTLAFVHAKCLFTWRNPEEGEQCPPWLRTHQATIRYYKCPTCHSFYKDTDGRLARFVGSSWPFVVVAVIFVFCLFGLKLVIDEASADKDERLQLTWNNEQACRARWSWSPLEDRWKYSYWMTQCLDLDARIQRASHQDLLTCLTEMRAPNALYSWRMRVCLVYAKRLPDEHASRLLYEGWILESMAKVLEYGAGDFRHIEDRCHLWDFRHFSHGVRFACRLREEDRAMHIHSLSDDDLWDTQDNWADFDH